jgi:hypothetical protein
MYSKGRVSLFVLALAASACEDEESSPNASPPNDSGGPSMNVCADLEGRIDDDLEIAPGARCQLGDVEIVGNIKVARGATLDATAISVEGNIQAEGAASIKVEASTIDGDIQVDDGGPVTVRDTTLGGNLQLVSNDGALLARGLDIEGDVQVFENGSPTIELRDNRVGGNLQCKENTADPTGGDNQVEGNKEDQCSAL